MEDIRDYLHNHLECQRHLTLTNKIESKLQGDLERIVERKLFTDLKFLFCGNFCDNLTEEILIL